ncbi:dihydrofolate reductase family protein [Kocuria sp. M1R5S2]|uniref:dihydrofolate reductase family protein n=1 Tax=Kocuria rhizosphaerae TaxID=3376285 RepID=UPI0037A80201
MGALPLGDEVVTGWSGHVYVGVSVDGFIARPDGDLSWLESRGAAAAEAGAGDLGYEAFMAGIDAVLLGRVTYEQVLGFGDWSYGDRPVVVLGSRSRAPRLGATGREEPAHRVRWASTVAGAAELLDEVGAREVYVDGGATIRSLLDAGRITDLVLTRVPVLLREGISPFAGHGKDVALELVSARSYPGGLVQETYRVVPDRSRPHLVPR